MHGFASSLTMHQCSTGHLARGGPLKKAARRGTGCALESLSHFGSSGGPRLRCTCFRYSSRAVCYLRGLCFWEMTPFALGADRSPVLFSNTRGLPLYNLGLGNLNEAVVVRQGCWPELTLSRQTSTQHICRPHPNAEVCRGLVRMRAT